MSDAPSSASTSDPAPNDQPGQTFDAQRPYAGLTPHAVLDALDAVGLRGDGRILQLNSYENRVFQVNLEDGAVVVTKFYRAGRWSDAQILEEHGFALELADAEVPVAPPLTLQVADSSAEVLGTPATLAHVGPWRLAVAARCAGRAPELEDPEVLRWIGRFLARIHLVGQRRPFQTRTRIDCTQAARAARTWLTGCELLPLGAITGWAAAADAALDRVDALFATVPNVQPLRLHGDCHAGNLLWRQEGEHGGPHFVDLDDACMGPAVQDLWMLIGGDRRECTTQLSELLDGYEQLREFDRRELGLIEALRTLRLIQHSAWIARRWADPAFPIAFPAFDSPSYWDQQATVLREQLVAMDEPPLVV
ncbi:MAG: serine/threonine protein kinase [Burkholderiales bacterium]